MVSFDHGTTVRIDMDNDVLVQCLLVILSVDTLATAFDIPRHQLTLALQRFIKLVELLLRRQKARFFFVDSFQRFIVARGMDILAVSRFEALGVRVNGIGSDFARISNNLPPFKECRTKVIDLMSKNFMILKY